MLDRFKRKLSRSKSISSNAVIDEGVAQERSLSLTPSDEQLIAKLTFSEDTNIVDKPPRNLNPSINTSFSERTVFNNIEKGILALPTEILLFFQPYLTPSSEVALRHTCSRFFHLFTTPSFYLSGDDKFQFVCMTERDQDPTQLARLVCGHCRDIHPRSSFPSSEVKQPPTERDCRQIWLCPHRSLGYPKTIKNLKAGAECPFRAETINPCSRCQEVIRHRSVADRPEKGTAFIDLESVKAESLLISKLAIMQAPTPSYNSRTVSGCGSYREVFPVKAVAAALQAIDFRICSHIKLGDPYILSKFCRSCINTQNLPPDIKGPPCISEGRREFGDVDFFGKCKGACFMRTCKTQFMFQARESLQPDASGRRQIWLIIVVYRWLGPLLTSGSDKHWRGHSTNHTERYEMRKNWDRWLVTSKNSRPMPNWSICLLHHADSHLRS